MVQVRRVNVMVVIMLVRVRVDKAMIFLVSVYAPHMDEKEEYYTVLGKVMLEISEKEMVMLGGNLNGHVGEDINGFDSFHGGKGIGKRRKKGKCC